ncbi:two-component system, chemotaxis family, response regulator CheB [Austwickia chelonae]|uniref:Protein-glutamate methylesterase/protein-glutamine glutaminase n=1 Tax=Austwickia chelonae NBRC 105200 TaxID=1184607 RepID=K6W7C8_9MICO|nr:chemotaxis response regulator protein-glutamate methylesterase [Austwickia chelonae]GAB77732.1 chemotaxis response regulator protein-glutamate methylesterase [Austwickia chelonae NBRC 105200]SEV88473.1 two-component system, chemotaxis family, response regulator CheB [Austwickia chelonae]
MASKIRAMVCDDSVVIRRLVSDVLAQDPEIEVVGTAVNGKNALDKIPMLKPDILTLDVEMPIMDGLQTLVEVRKTYKKLPIIMFSTLTERGAGATLDALERGASDYVTKPANVGSLSESMEAVRSQLIPKIKSLTGRVAPQPRIARPAFGGAPPAGQAAGSTAGPLPTPAPGGRIDVVAIGVSTGGPDALTTVVSALPANFPVPVVVTQHMPPVFTQLFAQRLDGKAKLSVREAVQGDPVKAGQVLIAPGDWHMRFQQKANGPVVVLDQGPQENYCRPAVDPMFRSIAEIYGAHVLSVIMTGMGSDGHRGAEQIIRNGGSLIVQDEATSVVWGMPGAAVHAGLPCDVLPLGKLAETITERVTKARSGGPAPRRTP